MGKDEVGGGEEKEDDYYHLNFFDRTYGQEEHGYSNSHGLSCKKGGKL